MARVSVQSFFKGWNDQDVVSDVFLRVKWPGCRFSPFLRAETARVSFQPFFKGWNGQGGRFRHVFTREMARVSLQSFLRAEAARVSFQPLLGRFAVSGAFGVRQKNKHLNCCGSPPPKQIDFRSR